MRIRRQLVVVADLGLPPPTAPTPICGCTCSRTVWCGPNSINLDGIFNVLPNVCLDVLGRARSARSATPASGRSPAAFYLEVRAVDKFPPMLDFVAPSGVRVADAARVRLGAHLAEGTTVMHEGFVNFDAGRYGRRWSRAGSAEATVVDAGTDVGGGASIMGTLSGGGKQVITIGQRCLLGANSGLGISLGDECVIEAGLYLTAGTVVTLPDGERVEARELERAGRDAVPPQQRQRRGRGHRPRGRLGAASARTCTLTSNTPGPPRSLAYALRT